MEKLMLFMDFGADIFEKRRVFGLWQCEHGIRFDFFVAEKSKVSKVTLGVVWVDFVETF